MPSLDRGIMVVFHWVVWGGGELTIVPNGDSHWCQQTSIIPCIVSCAAASSLLAPAAARTIQRLSGQEITPSHEST